MKNVVSRLFFNSSIRNSIIPVMLYDITHSCCFIVDISNVDITFLGVESCHLIAFPCAVYCSFKQIYHSQIGNLGLDVLCILFMCVYKVPHNILFLVRQSSFYIKKLRLRSMYFRPDSFNRFLLERVTNTFIQTFAFIISLFYFAAFYRIFLFFFCNNPHLI